MTDAESKPTVSVIVPSFNHENYVVSALDSVYAQSYQNIELIVVDDRSDDSSAGRISAWLQSPRTAARFRNIQFFQSSENAGAPASINAGLGQAQGQFLTILNSDDFYHPQRLEKLVHAAQTTQAELVFTAVSTVDENGSRNAGPGFSADIESMGDFALAHPSLSFALLKKNICITTGNLFFTARLAAALKGFRQLRYCHDWDFAVRAALRSEPVLLNEPLYSYRLHSSNSFKALQLEQFLEPQVVYRTFFAECRAGRCFNPSAPDPAQWFYFAEHYFKTGFYLKDAYKMSGQAVPLYDSIARMLRYNLGLVTT